MMTQKEADSVCSIMYQLRDALNDNNLPYALVLSREVHDMILSVLYSSEKLDCDLKSGCKSDEENGE